MRSLPGNGNASIETGGKSKRFSAVTSDAVAKSICAEHHAWHDYRKYGCYRRYHVVAVKHYGNYKCKFITPCCHDGRWSQRASLIGGWGGLRPTMNLAIIITWHRVQGASQVQFRFSGECRN